MRIIVLGDRDESKLTHGEIDATVTLLADRADVSWVATDSTAARELTDVDGIWLAPGTPYQSLDAVYEAISDCLACDRPLLGTCGGFQHIAVALARRAGVTRAGHGENEPQAGDLVVAPLACTLYGERRIVTPRCGTRFATICGVGPFEGFHWCGYGLDDRYVPALEAAGVVVSATAPDAGVEAIELAGARFLIATAFQPQVGTSESGTIHPLIEAFATEAAAYAGDRRGTEGSASVAALGH